MTGTNQADELFELCRKVHELTGWDGTQFYYHERDTFDFETHSFKRNGTHAVVERRRADYDVPLYSSDYLLEKLPYKIGKANSAIWLRLGKTRNGFTVFYIGSDLVWLYECESDTPLKALLKLTIALSEAGELNNE